MSDKYQVRFIPTAIMNSISGARGAKKTTRPWLMQILTGFINTRENGVVCPGYVLFGGIPSPEIHNRLVSVGFAVRREADHWTSKKSGDIVRITDMDNKCYAVYYNNEGDFFTPEQVTLLAKILRLTEKVSEKNKTFLNYTWDMVEESWKNIEDWLEISTYDPDVDYTDKEEKVEPPTTEDQADFAKFIESDELVD